ncbi:hypothetical protein QQX98_011598 [Neonectria punicea]|uniref:Peptidase S8/S53 domain-containing protein n=1 Tax=Neonectria punicea TaxID=979145 RepID=A0ABR1GL84_9HYPO
MKARPDETENPAGGTPEQLGSYDESNLGEVGRDEEEGLVTYSLHRQIAKSWVTGESITVHEDKYRSVLLKKDPDGRNIIHRVLSDLKSKNIRAPEKTLDSIEALVLEAPELFTTSAQYSMIPMIEASSSQINILFRVINLLIPQSALGEINVRCEQGCGQCPLWTVAEGRRNQYGQKINGTKDPNGDQLNRDKSTDKAQGKDITPQDGTYCLHDMIDVDGLLAGDRRLREVLKAGNQALPKQHGQTQPPCLQSLLISDRFTRDQDPNSQLIELKGFKVLLQLCPDEIFTNALPIGHSPLQMAVQLYNNQSVDCDLLFSVIQALVDRNPRSIFFKSGEGKDARTAYRLLKELGEPPSEQHSKSRKRAEELLKITCIGARRKLYDEKMKVWRHDYMLEEKRDFLYWNAKLERRFYLNLAGESVMLDHTYIDAMIDQSGMRFEPVLDFVKLPYWKPEDVKPRLKLLFQSPAHGMPTKSNRQLTGESEADAMIESDPYKGVFRWLWDSGVRKIYTVEVDDDGPEPHTNAAIREAFRGRDPETAPTRDFKIDVWKWKKFDICSETIVTAAPTVKEVHLFSHGNTAVLRGWASKLGLPKLLELETLRIEIFPKNENDEKDCRAYEEKFKQSLARKCPRLTLENIEIFNHGPLVELTCVEDETRDTEGCDQHTDLEAIPKSKEWIKQLDNFKDFMLNLGLSNKPSVKVALLDNGCKLTTLHGKQTGRSFSRDNKEYFVGGCEHGTLLASCIREVCPMAELYIARLDDSRVSENQKFTIASCYEALQWALDMEADIISMSWTFERKGGANDDHEKRFIDLITTAVASNKVIFFGALPDKGPTVDTHNFVPVGVKNVIRIGSATIHGDTSQDNLHAEPDFLLPGEELEFQPGKHVRGSSYATAYAAGLAAMVLYCLRAYDLLNEDVGDDRLAKALASAKTTEGMTVIFRSLSQTNHNKRSDRGAFVKPYITFGQDFNSGASEATILSRIIDEVLPPSFLRRAHL